MDDSAAASTMAFLAAGTLFTFTMGGLIATVDEYDPELAADVPDGAARELINVFVRPHGAAASPAQAGGGTVSSSSTSTSAAPAQQAASSLTTSGSAAGQASSQTATATSTSLTWTGPGCSGAQGQHCRATMGCDNGNTAKNHKECAAKADGVGTGDAGAEADFVGPLQESSSSPTSTSASGTPTPSGSGTGSATGTGTGASTGDGVQGNSLLAGLSIRPGVLDPAKVAKLIPGASTEVNATDGLTSYAEAKARMKYAPNVDFHLTFTKVRGNLPGPPTLMDFGSPRDATDASTASALFCWQTCDVTVRVDARVVR